MFIRAHPATGDELSQQVTLKIMGSQSEPATAQLGVPDMHEVIN